jgi:hypothetical protein
MMPRFVLLRSSIPDEVHSFIPLFINEMKRCTSSEIHPRAMPIARTAPAA